jgi:4a-hydroxytetrahydrobiopterin dehydratase
VWAGVLNKRAGKIMESTNTCLANKACIPCQGGVPPLTTQEVEKLLQKLRNGWTLNATGHLYKEYSLDGFIGPMSFANKIAGIAEKEAHHPDLRISWGTCTVEIWTHKINGLTESDFILAAKIEAI